MPTFQNQKSAKKRKKTKKKMASLTTIAAVHPLTIKGMGGSSLAGTRLSVRPTRRNLGSTNIRYKTHVSIYLSKCQKKKKLSAIFNLMNLSCIVWMNWVIRSGAIVAKYGDKSVYFDLEDIGNTTGQWDLYGSDAPSPYNSLQVHSLLHFTWTH